MKLIPIFLLLFLHGFHATFAAETNRVPATPASGVSYDSFRLIAERNIFNPNRYARSSRPEPRREVRTNAVVDSIVLTGIMSYEKGDVAFFDGSRAEYRKAARLNSTVGGFKVVEITPRQVKIVAGTNIFEVPVGMQLRRQEDDAWEIANRPESLVALTTGSSTSNSNSSTQDSGSSSGGTEDEVLKRLMQRREEMNR